MTTQELMSLARLSIRHQDFRLRTLIKTHESKSKRSLSKILIDIEAKAKKAFATAATFEQNEETDIQDSYASFLHYADSYMQKLAEMQKILKEKSDALTAKEQARELRKQEQARASLQKSEARIEKIKKQIEETKAKLEELNKAAETPKAAKKRA
jgi:cobalamin-dependent methionine synthase I